MGNITQFMLRRKADHRFSPATATYTELITYVPEKGRKANHITKPYNILILLDTQPLREKRKGIIRITQFKTRCSIRLELNAYGTHPLKNSSCSRYGGDPNVA